MDGFLKKAPVKILKFTKDDWRHIQMLLDKGYTPKEVFLIIGKNQKDILDIMNQGEDLEHFLISSQKGIFQQHLIFFSQFVPFNQAIKMTFEYTDFQEQVRDEFIKKSLYPFFVFLCAIGTLILFRSSILPMMQNSFALEQDVSFLQLILNFLYGIALLFLFLVTLIICYFMLHKLFPKFHQYFLLELTKKNRWFKDYLSYQFCGYFKILMKGGLSSKQLFLFLTTHTLHPVIKECANRIHQELEKGETLLNSLNKSKLLSDELIQMIEIGQAASSIDDLLDQYIVKQELAIKKRMKDISNCIIIIAYVYVAVLVLSVYQIMLMPLELLEHM